MKFFSFFHNILYRRKKQITINSSPYGQEQFFEFYDINDGKIMAS